MDSVNELTQLANSFLSDKGTTFSCCHNYTDEYYKIFYPLKQNPIKLLEIGLNLSGKNDIPSLRMWRTFFTNKNTEIHGLDILDKFKVHENHSDNVFIHVGDSSSKSSYETFYKDQFDIIVDDGSHESKHQQCALNYAWNLVKKGGYYIVEDLHYQPSFYEDCPKTRDLLISYRDKTPIGSKHIQHDVMMDIVHNSEISFSRSYSTKWPDRDLSHALAIIRKL